MTDVRITLRWAYFPTSREMVGFTGHNSNILQMLSYNSKQYAIRPAFERVSFLHYSGVNWVSSSNQFAQGLLFRISKVEGELNHPFGQEATEHHCWSGTTSIKITHILLGRRKNSLPMRPV